MARHSCSATALIAVISWTLCCSDKLDSVGCCCAFSLSDSSESLNITTHLETCANWLGFETFDFLAFLFFSFWFTTLVIDLIDLRQFPK